MKVSGDFIRGVISIFFAMISAICFTSAFSGTPAAATTTPASAATTTSTPAPAASTTKKPNIIMLMTDDTGWNDFGAYSGGGAALGHPTPNVDKMAQEGAVFTSWYGQASCTAGRASFITGRIPVRSALSIVIAPGDQNYLRKETPTIAEFFQKNGYSTYFSGKWHLGDIPASYPTEHGFDEMKHFAAYYAGVYAYTDTSNNMHPWFPGAFNQEFQKVYDSVVNRSEWEGVAGQPAKNVGIITYDNMNTFDMRQTDSAIAYIKQHANDSKPFFMDVNFIKMHNPTNPAPEFKGKSHLGNYSDSLMELDYNIGRIMEAVRTSAPNTIVILTADNGAWLDAYPDAGTTPFRGEKGSPFEGGWRVPAIMWWQGHIQAGSHYDELMSHIDAWATLAGMVGITPPPHDWKDNNGKGIYFDSIDNSAYILGKAMHSARNSWIYIDGETFDGIRADVYGGPNEPWVHMAWKYIYTAKDSWLGVQDKVGAIGALYNLTMDPYEKYDMIFNGAAPARVLTTSPGKYSGQDNGWAAGAIAPVMEAFDRTIMKYPNLRRFPGGASTDLIPNLQNPENPVPALKNSGKVNMGLGG